MSSLWSSARSSEKLSPASAPVLSAAARSALLRWSSETGPEEERAEEEEEEEEEEEADFDDEPNPKPPRPKEEEDEDEEPRELASFEATEEKLPSVTAAVSATSSLLLSAVAGWRGRAGRARHAGEKAGGSESESERERERRQKREASCSSWTAPSESTRT